MKINDLFYDLALQSVVGIGPVNARKLINHFGDSRQVLTTDGNSLREIRGLGQHIIDQLKSPSIYRKAEREIRFIEAHQIKALRYDEDAYPSKLRHCSDAPLVLFKKGNCDMNKQKLLSIVGTRRMTSYGRGFIKSFIQEIKKFKPVIISGLAYGVDICAHREALANGLSTIGILAHGLDSIYPKSHAGTAEAMLEKGGLITEFWSGNTPERENFVKRNRIIAGMSEALVVVESAKKGGSLITSELAQSYYREVFAVPGRATDPFSQGCNMLIKSNKAALITSADDLEYALGWSPVEEARKKVALKGERKQLYELLASSDKIQLDHLALKSGFSVQKTLIILLELELKGLVMSHPGKMFEAI